MSDLQILISKRNDISSQLKEIEVLCNGNENEFGTATDRILNAIKNQRWFFFKNKTKVIFDRDTGLLWANLHYYNAGSDKSGNAWDDDKYGPDDDTILNIINKLNLDGFNSWHLPTIIDVRKMIKDHSIPFCEYIERESDKIIIGFDIKEYKAGDKIYYLKSYNVDKIESIFVEDEHDEVNPDYRIFPVNLEHILEKHSFIESDGWCFPCTHELIENSDYERNVSPKNPNYSEKERLQFTLDLFTKNSILPIFNDEIITEIYIKIYYEKPKLMEQLKALQKEIENLQTVTLLSSEFDYTANLTKYDIEAINKSVIKYYQAVQQWTNELMGKLGYYENEKEDVIRDFNIIGLKLGKKYENSDILSSEENALLADRQRYFASRFSLGMNSVKSKILAVKHQADELEYRIDEIDNGDDAIHQLALLEKEERASFEFIAENTAKIIRNALKKIEYFEANHQYVVWAIEAWEQWTEKYKVFRTTYREELKSSCDEDGIEEEIWQKWYEDWQSIRFCIEQKFQPVVEHELHQHIEMINDDEITVVQQIIAELEVYRNAVDTFYREERKGIYQNFAFQPGGDIQDKLESESRLYKLTADFQQALQIIVFNCAKAEDRIFILNWANDLLDIQIDEVLEIISDNDLDSISETILTDFSELKKKNYEIYLADAKSYGEEQARRDKQFNSLLFKMRKGLK